MVPTFSGRLQTRFFLTLAVGVLWTLLVTLVVPRNGSLGETYKATFVTLLVVYVVGTLFWEPLYHLLMQFRWEKDWPTLFGLLTILNEGFVAWLLVFKVIKPSDSATNWTFFVHLLTTWIAIWLMANGPLRVVFMRWRFRGGEIVQHL